MRLPIRKSEKLKSQNNSPIYLTEDGIKKLERKINRLEKEIPFLIKEVSRTQEMGDLSENAAYQDAKYQMRKAQGSLFYAKEKLKNCIKIENNNNNNGVIELGSTVVVKSKFGEVKYHIVGQSEVNPLKGKISHISPIGNALLNKISGETISINSVKYEVIDVK